MTSDTGYKTYSNNQVGACVLTDNSPIHVDNVLTSTESETLEKCKIACEERRSECAVY